MVVEKNNVMPSILYSQIAHFCWKMKVIHGNDFLNVTLRNHPKIKNALTEFEKSRILELEREIDSLS